MPTGFTAALYDGPQSFEQFVRNAARGMGAFIHLRDESWQTPLTYPEDRTPEALAEFKEALRARHRWTRMSENEKYAAWSDYVHAITDRDYDHSEFYDRRNRFDAMIAKVQSVDVPEQLQTFKQFMLDQLGTEFQYSREPYMPTLLGFYEWCEAEDEMTVRRVDLRRQYLREARDRYAEVVEYIDLLAETFGFEVKRP